MFEQKQEISLFARHLNPKSTESTVAEIEVDRLTVASLRNETTKRNQTNLKPNQTCKQRQKQKGTGNTAVLKF